jgi:diaminohydroxyphosphoribosylaminopyrimidine deaminase/5-amino-6-(5-phosphoribosylamino)uracil reductase
LRNPVRVVVDRNGTLPLSLNLFNEESETLVFSTSSRALTGSTRRAALKSELSIVENLCEGLYNESLLSVIVEGGAETIQSFLDAGAWDEARVFTAPRQFGEGVKAPVLNHEPFGEYVVGVDTLRRYAHPALAERLNVSPNLAVSTIISAD